MNKIFQKVLVCLLSVGMACGLGGGIVLATEPTNFIEATEEDVCDNCTGEEDCACCCCTDMCEETGTGNSIEQTLALTPEKTDKPYHGHSFGRLEISGAQEEISLDIGEAITLTIRPYAHVQYVGCEKGDRCGPGLCNGGDESVFHCWEEGKGCVCDFKIDTLRLATVTVETDREGILFWEEICDYSMLETAGDMTDGQVVLTAVAEGTTTVTVKAALYDWMDAETTFTVTVSGTEDSDNRTSGEEEPGPAEPGDEDPSDANPDDMDPGTADPDEEGPDSADPGEEGPGPVEPDDTEPDDAEPDDADPDTADPGTADPDEEGPGPAEPGDEEPGVVAPSPAEPDVDGSGTDNPESGTGKTELLKGSDGKWGYYVNGKVDTGYTGFAKNDNGKWYVVNGYINFDQNSVYKDTTGAIGAKGTWYYVLGNKVQENFTGLANYKNANGWWYIVNGKVDFTHNGVDKNKNGWWYVTGGKVQFGYTGLANYKNKNGWWYIKSGKVDFSANTVAKNKNGWWYVTGGKVRFGFTGLAHYRNANGWWYIKSGKVDFSYKGIATNQNGAWYLECGKVQFDHTGTVTYGGKAYHVKNGKAT